MATFAIPINNVSTTLASNHTVGSGSLTVVNASLFPSLTGGNFYRVTVAKAVSAYSPIAPSSNFTIYQITAVSGNVLTVGSILEGSDQNFSVGDVVEIRLTAGTISDLQTYLAPLVSPTFTGTPSAPTATVATNTTQLATTAFVAANGVTIGNPVQGGTVSNILYVDSGGNLGKAANATWSSTNNMLQLMSTTAQESGGTNLFQLVDHLGSPKIKFRYNAIMSASYSTVDDATLAFGSNVGPGQVAGFNLLSTASMYWTNSAANWWAGTQDLGLIRGGTGTLYVNGGAATTWGALRCGSPSAGAIGMTVTAAGSQSTSIASFNNSSNTPLCTINKDGSVGLPAIANASAANNSLFWDTTNSKLCYKDPAGVLHEI